MGLMLGTLSFALCFALHVVIWRWRVPRKPYANLALLWVFSFVLVLIGAWLLQGLPTLSASIYGLILGAALIVSYMFFYVGIKHDSPTLAIIYEIQARNGQGLVVSDVEAFALARPFVRARLDQLIADGFVAREPSGMLRATGKVTVLLELNAMYRNWSRRAQVRG
jgi:hypothetical protein